MLYQKYRKEGFVVLGITSDANREQIQQVVNDTHISYPILADSLSRTFGLYNVTGIPFVILIDREGKIRWFHSGFEPGEETKIEAHVRQMMGEGK